MKKIFSTLVLAATLILLFLSSCATEEPAVEKQTGSLNVNRAADYFNNNPIALKNNFYFLGKPDWKKTVYVHDTLTVPFILERPFLIRNKNSDYLLRPYLLVTAKKGDNSFDYKLKVTFSPKANEATIKWYHIYNQANALISENGKKPIKKRRIKSETIMEECPYPNWVLFSSRSEAERERILNERLECVMRYYGNEEEEVPPPDGGSGEEDQTDAEIIEDQIYDTDLKPCPKEALTQLKNATNCDIANMLTKLGANSIYNLNIVSGIPEKNVPASTKRTNSRIPFNYTTTISTDYEDATSLFRASNILHEIAHAFFMSLKDDQDTGGGVATYGEFATLFQAYSDSKFPRNNEEEANVHHEEMANTYVDAIASTLQEYNKAHDPKGLVPYRVYSDLAWAGLSDAPIFDAHFKGKEAEKQRVLDRYRCESNGSTVGAGTPKAQTAVGKPCTK